MDLIETCARECQSTKWKFCKLTNITIFAALLKNVPVGCSDLSLPVPLLKNHYVHCLVSDQNKKPYNDKLCLFRALAIHLHGSSVLEINTKSLFTRFIEKVSYEAEQFQGVSFPDLHLVEEVIQHNIFIYDIDVEEGDFIGELARRSRGKSDKTVKLLR